MLCYAFFKAYIFKEVNGICGLCKRDRMDILYHILSGCPKLVRH
jgi:hypothetical protein